VFVTTARLFISRKFQDLFWHFFLWNEMKDYLKWIINAS
jgi:hypothetical protein